MTAGIATEENFQRSTQPIPLRLSSAQRLPPRLGITHGIALIVSNMVGVGIFTTPAIIAGLVPRPSAMLALWIVGGLLALAGAISYAELAKRFPSAGGEYVYLSRIYGPSAGFLSGWISLIAGFSGAVAAGAVGLVSYLGWYLPSYASDRILLKVPLVVGTASISPRSLCAAAIIALLALLHACGFGLAKFTQNGLALLIASMIAVFAFCGFAFGHGAWMHFATPESLPHVQFVNWLIALIPVMFTYSGWNAAVYVSEDLRDARRTIGPILILGTSIVVALYVVLNILYLYAIAPEHLHEAINVGDVAAHALFGVNRMFITPVLIVALLGSLSAMTIAGSRVYFAMARDGAFFPAFARISRRFGTPAFAIALQALWSIALVMAGGFEQILMYTGFAVVLSSSLAVAGLFVVDRHALRSDRRLRFKMLIPAAFLIASGLMVANMVIHSPRTAATGALLILSGLPIYAWSRRKKHLAMESQPGVVPAD